MDILIFVRSIVNLLNSFFSSLSFKEKRTKHSILFKFKTFLSVTAFLKKYILKIKERKDFYSLRHFSVAKSERSDLLRGTNKASTILNNSI